MNISTIPFAISKKHLKFIQKFFSQYALAFLIGILITTSITYFIFYYQNGLGLSYNDARSHLDIGRRVVEGLKTGLAQLGSVWLPLPHLLMVLTVWNDFMWHSGLSGAIQSMIAFVVTSAYIYLFLKQLKVSLLGRIFGVIVFVANLNVLYLQSTAMTEMLLLMSLTVASYYLYLWHQANATVNLIKAAFWIMISTLIRYEGWFLLVFAGGLVVLETLRKKSYKTTEGTALLYGTLAGFGIILWLIWNQLIFGDALYFVFGPYSAHAQQEQLSAAGVLATKGNLLLSLQIYLYALIYNSGAYSAIMALLGAILLWFDKRYTASVRIASTALIAPFLFNILALFLGHSVLFIQGISGNTWFNVRYGIMMAPSIAIFMGYLVHRLKDFRWVIIGLFLFITFFAFSNEDAVTIDDARVGSSQKNVSEVSGWLAQNATGDGFILISAASHDAIIFSSGYPMAKFIHEGTGNYWTEATTLPDHWARWIIMRTNDVNDMTFKLISQTPGYERYQLVQSFPFADIYELKPEYVAELKSTQELISQMKAEEAQQ